MSKSINHQRIIKAHGSLDRYRHYLLDNDQNVVQEMMMQGMNSLFADAFEQKPDPIKRTKNKLELAVLDVFTAEDIIKVRNRFFDNLARYHRRSDKVQALQVIHDVSGLELGQSKIGGGVIDHWKPIEDFKLTANDLKLLKVDRLRLLEFWSDHVTMQGLKVFQDKDNDWSESSLEFVRVASREYHWITFWEDITYEKPTEVSSHGVTVIPTSKTPKEGYIKSVQIFLTMGNGRNLDSAAESLQFCATTGDYPCC
jgi:hypothetical protein